MLYPKNQAGELSRELFENPTSEYRGAPFWAWNTVLDKNELERQAECLKEMGFGGYHMHCRTGMATPYMSDEFLALVGDCVKKAEDEGMLAWLYDEDRWPSGFGGGLVTKNPEYRAKYLLFTPVPYGKGEGAKASVRSSAAAGRSENGELLAVYDVALNPDGTLGHYARADAGSPAGGTRWYAYLETPLPNPWYNNQTYVDTLNPQAIRAFLACTHEKYREKLGEKFGKSIPAIFTDEPQFVHKQTLDYADSKMDVVIPWTTDMEDTFQAAYGESLLDRLPELFWEQAEGQVSLTRYRYHDHVAERFSSAFADSCGDWCRKNGLALTGHMMEEPTLQSQTAALGEAMRSYRAFAIPGIDMLCDRQEYTTAKQAQSAVHQLGREGMLSELYGVTNWDFDFRGHKLQGDWQAALGVTVRVPHLSWVSMKGEAKRDYPASINYQSPWYREYPLIENHFARLNTALTRGKPRVKVGVIHPVETFWLHYGPKEQTKLKREELDERFESLTRWLLFGAVDFDFICESLLPGLCEEAGAPLRVGEMAYDVVLVPGCETLRGTTLERLEAFRQAGGNLIFLGDAPKYIDVRPDSRGEALYRASRHIGFGRTALMQALEDVRDISILGADGGMTDNLIYQMREDGEGRWLFVCHGKNPKNPDIPGCQALQIRLKGAFSAECWDTMTGKVSAVPVEVAGGKTVIRARLGDQDSLLLRLVDYRQADIPAQAEGKRELVPLALPVLCPVTLEEPNVCLLDLAEYRLDGEDYRPEEEILRLDNACRARLGYPSRMEAVAQPWVIPEEAAEHTVSLRFTVASEIAVSGVQLALEDAEQAKIRCNGVDVPALVTGWFTDRDIRTVALPELKAGENIIEVTLPFGRRTNTEWCYLLGDFGVRVQGRKKTLTAPVRMLAFGDSTVQGLPFYAGNLCYHLDIETTGGGLLVRVPQYRGALLGVELDGQDAGRIAFSPNTLELPEVKAGRHRLTIRCFGTRVNAFGCVHNCDPATTWYGPNCWRTEGDAWCYEYVLRKTGVLTAPVVCEIAGK